VVLINAVDHDDAAVLALCRHRLDIDAAIVPHQSAIDMDGCHQGRQPVYEFGACLGGNTFIGHPNPIVEGAHWLKLERAPGCGGFPGVSEFVRNKAAIKRLLVRQAVVGLADANPLFKVLNHGLCGRGHGMDSGLAIRAGVESERACRHCRDHAHYQDKLDQRKAVLVFHGRSRLARPISQSQNEDLSR